MKSSLALLFLIGLVIGGAIMLVVLGSQATSMFFTFDPSSAATESPPRLPKLLAPESTDLPIQPTHTGLPPTITAMPEITSVATSLTSTVTPLALLHPQQANIIGYSVEARPLHVYRFGNEEHQRMSVAEPASSPSPNNGYNSRKETECRKSTLSSPTHLS